MERILQTQARPFTGKIVRDRAAPRQANRVRNEGVRPRGNQRAIPNYKEDFRPWLVRGILLDCLHAPPQPLHQPVSLRARPKHLAEVFNRAQCIFHAVRRQAVKRDVQPLELVRRLAPVGLGNAQD